MSVTLTPKPPSSTRNGREPRDQRAGKRFEKVTLDNLWPDGVPFIALVVLLGMIVYLISRK